MYTHADPNAVSDQNIQDEKPRPPSQAEQRAKDALEWVSNNRNIIGLSLIIPYSIVSLSFNVIFGGISANNDVSKWLLPIGFALIDLALLFLASYLFSKATSRFAKGLAAVWFVYLLVLSMWAASAYVIGVDYEKAMEPLDQKIVQKSRAVDIQKAQTDDWLARSKETKKLASDYRNKLNLEQKEEADLTDELEDLKNQRIPTSLVIYYKVGSYLEIDPEKLQTAVRLAWAGALTLGAIILTILLGAENKANLTKADTSHNDPTDTPPTGNDGDRSRQPNTQNSIPSNPSLGTQYPATSYASNTHEPMVASADTKYSIPKFDTSVLNGSHKSTETPKNAGYQQSKSTGIEQPNIVVNVPEQKPPVVNVEVIVPDTYDDDTPIPKKKRAGSDPSAAAQARFTKLLDTLGEDPSPENLKISRFKSIAGCGQTAAEKLRDRLVEEGYLVLNSGNNKMIATDKLVNYGSQEPNKPLLRAIGGGKS